MKRFNNENTRNIITFLLVATFCLTLPLPEYFVSDETMAQFERILFTVLGFYFGSNGGNETRNNKK